MQGAFLVVKSSNLEVSGEPHRVQRVQQDSKCSCRSALMHCQVTVSVWKWQCKDSVTACSLGQINKVVVERGRGGKGKNDCQPVMLQCKSMSVKTHYGDFKEFKRWEQQLQAAISLLNQMGKCDHRSLFVPPYGIKENITVFATELDWVDLTCKY